MKNKYIFRYKHIGLIFFCLAILYSCKKEAASVDDHFLNYTIPDVPATSDYTVGAFYYTFTTFNASIAQVPTIGKYTYVNGVPPATVMEKHIAQAATAKIDYFIFQVRSPMLDAANYQIDSTSVSAFLNADGASNMNFALSYNLNPTLLGITNSGGTNGNGITLETNAANLNAFYKDFERISFFMKQNNYQKVNGKYLLIINNAQDLNSNDNVALYKQLRANLSALGFELYIIGMQNRWQPPQRYFYRFENCTDAMYEANMGDVAGDNNRFFLFPQYCDQNFAYYKTMLESMNLEFVPCVQAAYNYQITAPTVNSLSTPRTADGAWYRTFTNIAKRSASKSRLILVDSFNDFSHDTQIESTESYGSLYLDITREAFKVN